jgi:DNA replication protein DnaC
MSKIKKNPVELLNLLKLPVSAEQLTVLKSNNDSLDFDILDDTIIEIFEPEYIAKLNRRIHRLIKNATFIEQNACIEEIDWDKDRHLNKNLIIQLSSCKYIDEKQDVIILGASGSGKTYLSNALGNMACRNSYSVKYLSLKDLFSQITLSRLENTFDKYIASIKRFKLLIIDEWLLNNQLTHQQKIDLLDVVSGRYLKNSTIYCSNHPIADWIELLGVSALSESIIDRCVHHAHVLTLGGSMSMRQRRGLNKNPQSRRTST